MAMMLKMGWVVILSCFVIWVQDSRADTIYSNISSFPGVSDKYGSTGYAVSGDSSFIGFVQQAVPFTPTGNFDLTQIDVGINACGCLTDGVVFSLVNDSGGLPTGTIIESWTRTGLPLGSTSILQTLIPISSVELLAGTHYWIVASPNASSTQDGWNRNAIGATGTFATNLGSGWLTNSDVLPAYDVLGTPVTPVTGEVPEPSTMVLLGTGFGAIAWLRKRTIARR